VTIPSSSLDVSYRYNKLKAACDNLMEATEHANPQGFHAAVTVVLERLKKDELKRKGAAKAMKILSHLPPGTLLPADLFCDFKQLCLSEEPARTFVM
jgi:hypothetical protein